MLKVYYKGNFSEGYRSGKGIEHSRNGNYNGDWLEGSKHGKGIMNYSSGARY